MYPGCGVASDGALCGVLWWCVVVDVVLFMEPHVHPSETPVINMTADIGELSPWAKPPPHLPCPVTCSRVQGRTSAVWWTSFSRLRAGPEVQWDRGHRETCIRALWRDNGAALCLMQPGWSWPPTTRRLISFSIDLTQAAKRVVRVSATRSQ